MNIALLGYGVVGGGVYEMLKEHPEITVRYVLDRERHEELGERSITDYSAALSDPEVDTVVELIGGLEPAFQYVKDAMAAGKNVVTANKYLLAMHYDELLTLAKEKKVSFRASASVGGSIPWLPNLERAKRTGLINEVGGIMNGTTNYILDSMTRNGYSFESVLADAQRLGYAEADPSADIDGLDVKRKCLISANVAFDMSLSEEQLPVFGIRNVTAEDIACFKEHGYVCKLYATARRLPEGEYSAFVEPTLFPAGSLEASVPANYNLISYLSEYAGRQSYYGEGAGRYPTANAVVEDLIDIKEGYKPFYSKAWAPTPINNVEVKHRYYVRYLVDTWFMDGVVDERWENGMITKEITPAEMHYWYNEAKQNDPDIFFAALRA